MANWIKYKDQPRINLDKMACYGIGNANKIWFDSDAKQDRETIYWELEFEQELGSILEWLDKIVGVREFGVRQFKIEEPRPKKEYVPCEEPIMPF